MSKGRGAWNCFSAGCEFYETLRSIGARGVVINFYLSDGQLFTASERHFKARHKLFYSDLGPDLDDVTDWHTLENLEWTKGIRCRSHGCSLAVVWSLKSVSTKEKNTDVHNSVRSLRGSLQAFIDDLDGFLLAHLAFSNRGDRRDEVDAFWRFLMADDGAIETLVEVNPWWDGESLHVNAPLQADPEMLSKVTFVVLYCLRPVDWSETRWVKVRKSSAFWVRSEVVGIKRMVQRMMHNADLANSYVGGYFKLDYDRRFYFITGAFSATPPEAILLSLMKDDRLLKKVPETKWLNEFQANYIFTLPDLVWARCLAEWFGPAPCRPS